jgi:nucleotide-binding universal stress UspA family protein
MISIERILCPASLPHESEEALGFAVSLARAFGSKLFFCHYAGAPALVTPVANRTAQGLSRKFLEDSLTRHLERAAARERYLKRIVVGYGNDAGEEIVREAAERRIDLIVMRSRRSRVAALLGSTAEHVSRTAPCPVLIIRSKMRGHDGEQNGETRFKRVLVAHDFSSSSELALSYAFSIAQKYKAELHLIHVLPGPQTEVPDHELIVEGVESVFHRVIRRMQDAVPGEVCRRCKVVNAVRWGKAYREVLTYSRQQNVDLVCMGALGRDFGMEALFGSNADRVLRQASSHVLIARPLNAAMCAPLDPRRIPLFDA